MPRSIAFYRDVLGFQVVSTSQPGPNFDWALLSLNGVEPMLNTTYDEGARRATPDPARTAAHGDTAIYFGCPDVDAAYAHLRARNISVKPPEIAHYGMNPLYVSDPDGSTGAVDGPLRRSLSINRQSGMGRTHRRRVAHRYSLPRTSRRTSRTVALAAAVSGVPTMSVARVGRLIFCGAFSMARASENGAR
jgi:glyoxylase I family protein